MMVVIDPAADRPLESVALLSGNGQLER